MSDKTSIRAPLPGQQKKDPAATPPPAPRISQPLAERPEPPAPPEPAPRAQPAPVVPPPAQAMEDGFPNVDDLARLLVELAGPDAFAELAANPRLRVPLPDEDDGDAAPPAQAWLASVLRAFMTMDSLRRLQAGLRASLGELHQRLADETARCQQAEAALADRDAKIVALERRLSDTTVQQHRAKEALHRTLPIAPLIEQSFGSDPRIAEVRGALRSALDQPSEALGPFVIGFCLGWIEVRLGLAESAVDEHAKVERLGRALRSLLARLSGLYIPERRDILRSVGAYVSAHFLEYDFVSPEDWRDVDPSVHNAGGIGGHSVKEGISYAVLRRGNRQTVIHADILVE